MSLNKRPISSEKYGWEELNRYLDTFFTSPNTSVKPFAYVDLGFYSMSTEEIIDAGKQNGYTVTDIGNNQLKFE